METVPGLPPLPSVSRRDQDMREAARTVETAFVAEVLKSAGIAQPRAEFGGGPGEDQFASLLQAALAEEIVDAGGFGVAEQVYRQLRAGTNGQ